MENKKLISKRLFLRPVQKGDFSLLQALWVDIYGQSFAGAKVFDMMNNKQLNGEAVCWLISFNECDNKIIGTCEINNLALERCSGDLGCELAPTYQGQGYMQDALRCVMQYAFAQLQLTTLAVNIKEDNEKSRRLFTRLGFVETGQTVKIGNIILQRFFCKREIKE